MTSLIPSGIDVTMYLSKRFDNEIVDEDVVCRCDDTKFYVHLVVGGC